MLPPGAHIHAPAHRQSHDGRRRDGPDGGDVDGGWPAVERDGGHAEGCEMLQHGALSAGDMPEPQPAKGAGSVRGVRDARPHVHPQP